MEKRIAQALLSIGAVFLRPEEPFTWASGIKSPIYCDNRLTLTAPEVRDQVENGLMETIRREYPDVQVLMGTSTSGHRACGDRGAHDAPAHGLRARRQQGSRPPKPH